MHILGCCFKGYKLRVFFNIITIFTYYIYLFQFRVLNMENFKCQTLSARNLYRTIKSETNDNDAMVHFYPNAALKATIIYALRYCCS